MSYVCSAETSSASTYLMWIKYRRSLSTLPNDFAWSILNDLYTQYDKHLQRWFPGDPSGLRVAVAEISRRSTDTLIQTQASASLVQTSKPCSSGLTSTTSSR